MIIDMNAWVGGWPFRALRDNTPEELLRRLDRCGIQMAAVSSIESVMYRNVQSANECLAADLAPYKERLFPLATINPTNGRWRDDFHRCIDELQMKGVRLFPQYHQYGVNGSEIKDVIRLCGRRGVSVFISQRIEDHRQRHHFDGGADALSLAHLAKLVEEFPKTNIVITNARGIARSPLMSRHLRTANWYVDLSRAEVFYELHRDVNRMRDLADVIDQGAADHLVFGTHLPFSYAGAAMIKRAILPVDEQTLHEICFGRARRILGI